MGPNPIGDQMFLKPIFVLTILAGCLAAQDPQAPAAPAPAPKADGYSLAAGTKVPLSVLNSVSTKSAQPGDHVYLETAFPLLSNGRIVVPAGSWVEGSVTDVKKAGHGQHRAELYIRFDTLTLPNGVQRDLRSRMDNMGADSSGEVDRAEGKVRGETNGGDKAKTAGEIAVTGV